MEPTDEGNAVPHDGFRSQAGMPGLPWKVIGDADPAIKTLFLEVRDAGDGNGFDHANWADARIEYEGSRPVMELPVIGPLGAIVRHDYVPRFSTAGFFQTDRTVREAAGFNIGWRFLKGEQEGAESNTFDDSSWQVVNTPHGLESLPLDASGGVNYQGPAWYRKRFSLDPSQKNRKVFLHFEAIMGRSQIWINGELVKENFGGYLPIHLYITEHVKFDADNLVAVRADNSDDPAYPPGKPQSSLDFTYCGGIYRDVHLITTNRTYVTNPNAENLVAGGGVFVRFEDFSRTLVKVVIDTHIRNEAAGDGQFSLECLLRDRDGITLARSSAMLPIPSGEARTSRQEISVTNPHLWHVDDPYLHQLDFQLRDSEGRIVDAFAQRIGLRKIEFRGKEGFFLNGEPFRDKLVGANRHQDFALLGNAVPNTTQWRDAQKLRNAALRVVRCAHYPMDPAFMDACDELGLFVIVATPGWQFWNKEANPLPPDP